MPGADAGSGAGADAGDRGRARRRPGPGRHSRPGRDVELRLVREHRIERRGAVAPGGELDVERVGAGFDEHDDALVLLDRLAGTPRHEAERRVAEHRHAVPAAVHEVEEVRVRACLEEHRVELEVQRGETVRVEVVERLTHPLVDLAGTPEVVGREIRRRQRGRGTLDDRERLHGVQVLGLVDERHLRADVALEGHEPLGFEQPDRLAHGHDAHIELARDLPEHEPEAGHVATVVDALANESVGLLRFAFNGMLRLGVHRSEPGP